MILNHKHYVCTTHSSLLADRFHTKMRGRFVFTLYHCEISYRSEILTPVEQLGWTPAQCDLRWHDILWGYHVTKCRAMRGNRSELTPAQKSPRCHVNTPLITYLITLSLEKEIIVWKKAWKKSSILNPKIFTDPLWVTDKLKQIFKAN